MCCTSQKQSAEHAVVCSTITSVCNVQNAHRHHNITYCSGLTHHTAPRPPSTAAQVGRCCPHAAKQHCIARIPPCPAGRYFCGQPKHTMTVRAAGNITARLTCSIASCVVTLTWEKTWQTSAGLSPARNVVVTPCFLPNIFVGSELSLPDSSESCAKAMARACMLSRCCCHAMVNFGCAVVQHISFCLVCRAMFAPCAPPTCYALRHIIGTTAPAPQHHSTGTYQRGTATHSKHRT